MRTLWGGGGALEGGDLRLLEDGSERRGTLSSNIVPGETANEGQSRNVVGEEACQRALTQKRTLYGAAAHFSSFSTRFPLMQLAIVMTVSMAASAADSAAPPAPMPLPAILQARGRIGTVRK